MVVGLGAGETGGVAVRGAVRGVVRRVGKAVRAMRAVRARLNTWTENYRNRLLLMLVLLVLVLVLVAVGPRVGRAEWGVRAGRCGVTRRREGGAAMATGTGVMRRVTTTMRRGV
jgi:hypothetical protein